ncbi:hypothetical protein ACN9MZ_26115 [Pseudoduganella sp. S-14]|uniref:hypothetical protein n=1 Tax=Pseudoduganella sp. S-14 TaxID=3404065 RepID=UPI003CE9D0D2
MSTRTLDDDFDITHSTAGCVGQAYECVAVLIRRADNSVVGSYRGEGATAAKAEAAARSKANEAYYALPLRIDGTE